MFRPFAFLAVLAFFPPPRWRTAILSASRPPAVSPRRPTGLEAAVAGAGATVFARVDHGAGPPSVDMELGDAEPHRLRHPRLGTPVLQADIRAGLVLPLRVLVHDDGGQTVFLYEDPAAMLERYDVPADLEAVATMTAALGNLTEAAAN